MGGNVGGGELRRYRPQLGDYTGGDGGGGDSGNDMGSVCFVHPKSHPAVHIHATDTRLFLLACMTKDLEIEDTWFRKCV